MKKMKKKGKRKERKGKRKLRKGKRKGRNMGGGERASATRS